MTSPVTQEPTNLTYGFTAMLLKLLRDYAPDYIAVAMDVGGDKGTFRTELYPDYKANRERDAEDLPPQVTVSNCSPDGRARAGVERDGGRRRHRHHRQGNGRHRPRSAHPDSVP